MAISNVSDPTSEEGNMNETRFRDPKVLVGIEIEGLSDIGW
jgi:hypothetical protein